ASLALGTVVGTKNISKDDVNVGQAHRADMVLKNAGFQRDPQTEIVVIQSTTATVHDSAFRAAIADVVATVRPFTTITDIRSPLSPAHTDQVSADGRTALVEFTMKGNDTVATDNIDAITKATDSAAKRHPSIYIGEAGSISSSKALNAEFGKQLAQAGERSVPLTLLILVIVFGALMAAGIPLLLALSAVMATLGLLALPSHLIPMDQNVSAVVLLIGLAVGVDYSLFYLKREREERAAGRSSSAALEAAAATSGRSVLISGVTVMVAMAGLLFTGDKTFMSFGVGTIVVVAVAMLGSLTVLPALMSKLGDRVEKGRIPFVGRLRREGGESRVWSRILTPALNHPVITLIAAASVLLAMAVPVLHMHTSVTGMETLPRSLPTVETLDRISSSFPGNVEPALVAITGDADSAQLKNAVNDLRARALKSGQMKAPIQVDVNASHTVTRVSIPLAGKGVDETSSRALATLRNTLLPATIGTVPNASYAVTGGTAASVDYNRSMKHSAPLVFGFVLAFAFLLLLVSFRSIVIPIKAIVLNLLSVGAAYGVLVAVFQWGWGETLFNFKGNGGISNWLPIFMFVILFGLSMDYHVFILSRVREAYDRGLTTEEAVEHGIKTTAGVVTSAAVVMVGAFAIFATLPIIDMKEMGIGLAAAVLIDATIVRGALLPAAMKLLGDWNWYLPKWLEWLPRIEHEESAPEALPVPLAA
ncbi:MAG: hypothetical protein QOK34_2024, partial [Gaiellaceae bacterium]|nr:hypothetical protein [Gaiellaceae bacterium]